MLFYNLAQDASCHEGLIEKKAIRLIVHTAHATTLAVVQELCIAALCTLSTNVGHKTSPLPPRPSPPPHPRSSCFPTPFPLCAACVARAVGA